MDFQNIFFSVRLLLVYVHTFRCVLCCYLRVWYVSSLSHVRQATKRRLHIKKKVVSENESEKKVKEDGK